jgi:hypothetical protein
MAITRTQIARQLYRYGGDTMGGPNDRSMSGPGPDDRSSIEQTMNTRAAIRDAQRSNKIDPTTITNTVGDAMLLKNLINLNPMGIIKNIGSKMILDKVTQIPDTEEDDSPMQVAELTKMQQKALGKQKPGYDLGLFSIDDVRQNIEPLGNPDNPATNEEIQEFFQQAKDGGRIGLMEGGMPYEGGIMDLESARQMYGLGKLVKKVTRSVKKIAKSPIGKAAIGYALTGGLSNLAAGQSFGTNFFSPTSFISKGGIKNIFTKQGLGNIGSSFGLGSMVSQKTAGDSVIKQFVPNMLGKIATSPSGLIAGASLLAGGLTAEQEEEAQQISDETGIDIAEIRANPNKYLARRFRAEGGSTEGKEPVAKKVMPLLDMDGQEKDYRETGGFVDMGRMEKADDVPARLSKNEFVFTADAVRNAGDGSVDKGAEVMYNMMKNLESGGDVSEESQGLEGARKMFQTSQRLEEVL